MIVALSLGAMLAGAAPSPVATLCEALTAMRPHVAAVGPADNPLSRPGPVKCEALLGAGHSCTAVPDAQGPGAVRCRDGFVRPFSERTAGRLSAAMLFVAAHELAHLARSRAGSVLDTATLTGSGGDRSARLLEALQQQTESIEEERETDALALSALRRMLLTPAYRYHADPDAGLWSAGANLREAFGRPAPLADAPLDELPVPGELVDRAAVTTLCAVLANGDVSRLSSLPSTHPSWSSRAWRVAQALAPASQTAPTHSPLAGAPHELLVEWSAIDAFMLQHEAAYLDAFATRTTAAVADYEDGKIVCPREGEPRWAGRRLSPARTAQCPSMGVAWSSAPIRRVAPPAEVGGGPFAVVDGRSVVAAPQGIVRLAMRGGDTAFELPCAPVSVATLPQRSAVQCAGGAGWVLVDWSGGRARLFTPDFGGRRPFPLVASGVTRVGDDLVLSYGTAAPGYMLAAPRTLDGRAERYPRGEQPGCDDLQQLGAPRPFATAKGLQVAVADQLCARAPAGEWSCTDPPIEAWTVRALDDDAPPQPGPTFACGPGAGGRSLCLDVDGRLTETTGNRTAVVGKIDLSLGADATLVEWCSARHGSWALIAGAMAGDARRTLLRLAPNPPSATRTSPDTFLACDDGGAWVRAAGAPRRLR